MASGERDRLPGLHSLGGGGGRDERSLKDRKGSAARDARHSGRDDRAPRKAEREVPRGTRGTGVGTVALVRLRMSVHRRVEVPLWRCFPPRVESNCVLATGRGEQLETKG